MVEVTIPLSDEQVRALRHEEPEPYGQQVRVGIFDTLRTALDQPATQQQEVDGEGAVEKLKARLRSAEVRMRNGQNLTVRTLAKGEAVALQFAIEQGGEVAE